MNRLEVLSPELLQSLQEHVKYIDQMTKELNKQLGWHYILDIAWILEQVKDLPKGAVILDGGGGYGLLQFILFEKGYNVISVDFIDRNLREAEIEKYRAQFIHDREIFGNEYVQHLNRNYGNTVNAEVSFDVIDDTLLFSANSPKIVFYRGDLSRLSYISDNSIDCIVSLSALEHNPKEIIGSIYEEFKRICKADGIMALTLSGTEAQEDWFHVQSKGWCFTQQTLVELFQLDLYESNFNHVYDIFQKLKLSSKLEKRLAPLYFKSGENGMPWGVWNPEYIPVGVSLKLS